MYRPGIVLRQLLYNAKQCRIVCTKQCVYKSDALYFAKQQGRCFLTAYSLKIYNSLYNGRGARIFHNIFILLDQLLLGELLGKFDSIKYLLIMVRRNKKEL